jgi:RNA polymerase sigma factor (sigma-70 family)
MADSLDISTEHLLRDLAPQVLGVVLHRFRDFSSAEDAVQEALIAAASQWPRDGVPDNPRGWLIRVAIRRMTDHIRSEHARMERETAVVSESTFSFFPSFDPDAEAISDDTLVLLFMCCHPVLSKGSAIPLTLRAVGGLTTAEIANAFLVPESTMAQRITRAKNTIKSSGVRFHPPSSKERGERLHSVLHVLYLIFNEGYTSSAGPALQRIDLSTEAIRLTRALRALLPDDSEIAGLLALMLLTDARREARTGPAEELIPLNEQDRTLWNSEAIAEGTALLTMALQKGSVGSYTLQAAIAALHDEAGSAEDTDWPQILAFYELLKHMSDNPMVLLNHAVAAAMVHGAGHGLDLLKQLETDPRMTTHHRLSAIRAHLLELSGDRATAISHYRAAAQKTSSIPERNYLLTRAARLSACS